MRKAPVQIREVKESKADKSRTHIIQIRRAFTSGVKGRFRHSSNLYVAYLQTKTDHRSQGTLEIQMHKLGLQSIFVKRSHAKGSDRNLAVISCLTARKRFQIRSCIPQFEEWHI